MLDELRGKVKLEIEEGDELPEIIPNSTLQLDGDISCYYSAWTDMPLGACINQLKRHIETKRILAGCEIVNVHTTVGKKAGREDIAQLQMYQDTRKKNKDPEKSARVAELRQFLQDWETETVKPCPQFEVEADDSMNIYQRIEIDLGNHSAICTKDKDLNMCPGQHHDYDSMDAFQVPDDYGNIWVIETQKKDNSKRGYHIDKKVTGVGTSFFWVQLIWGDIADSIPGLPRLPGKLMNKYKPTKAVTAAQERLRTMKGTKQQIAKAQKTIWERKSAACGAQTAYTMLQHCTTDVQAMNICVNAYAEWYGKKNFKLETWRGEVIDVTAGKMLLEQARLLWMLRTWDDDVLKFLTEVGARPNV